MKTLSQFLEATEGDLRSMGANSAQVAELKRRQAERAKKGIDKGFDVGDDRRKSTPKAEVPKYKWEVVNDPKSTAITRRQQKALPPSGGVKRLPTPTKSSALATRPADKGAEMVRKKSPKMSKKVKAKTKPVVDEKQAGQRPGTTRPKPQAPGRTLTQPTGGDLKKKKKKNKFGKFAKGAALGALGAGARALRPRNDQVVELGKAGGDLKGSKEIIRGERK